MIMDKGILSGICFERDIVFGVVVVGFDFKIMYVDVIMCCKM